MIDNKMMNIGGGLTMVVSGLILMIACAGSAPENTGEASVVSDQFKQYWYDGMAEITSYQLEQARYGQMHKGHAVLVFVTEPFSPTKFVKPDRDEKSDVSVSKLNFTKKFTTGIYPYSMMTSSFFPLSQGEHALKVTTSSQEWCGHTFLQLLNKKKFDISGFSYFESEGDRKMELNKAFLEDDIWSRIRKNPEKILIGEFDFIPSFFYLRLKHKEIKSYRCEISKKQMENGLAVIALNYPALNRMLSIIYETSFPYNINSWEEIYEDGAEGKSITTGRKIKTLKSAYWQKNGVKDSVLRKQLGL